MLGNQSYQPGNQLAVQFEMTLQVYTTCGIYLFSQISQNCMSFENFIIETWYPFWNVLSAIGMKKDVKMWIISLTPINCCENFSRIWYYTDILSFMPYAISVIQPISHCNTRIKRVDNIYQLLLQCSIDTEFSQLYSCMLSWSHHWFSSLS